MKRVLKCDGLLPAKINKEGKLVEVQPEDIREMKTYVDANRSLTTPFDIVVEGKTASLDRAQMLDKLRQWTDAGATWWTESLWGEPEDRILARIRQGPPSLD